MHDCINTLLNRLTHPTMNTPRPTLTAAYKDGGIHPPNILNEWTALDVERNVVTFQLDENSQLHEKPVLGKEVEGASLYHTFGKDALIAWNNQCIADGRPLPNKQQGWRKLRFDFDYAIKHDSRVRFIHIRYGRTRPVEQIESATFRHDWIGMVTHLHPNSGCYEVAIMVVSPDQPNPQPVVVTSCT